MSEKAKRKASRDPLGGSAAAVEGGSRPTPAIMGDVAAVQPSERQSLEAESCSALG